MTKAIVLAITLFALPASADWQVNMNKGVTEISRDVFDLHMLIFWICVVIGVAVFSVMFYSIFKHRKSKGAVAEHWHENTTVEVLWTVIPFAILIGMAIPATGTLMDMYDTDEADIDIQVTGYQWKWRYEYLNEDIDFFSNLSTPREEITNAQVKNPNYLLEVDNPLVIPVNQKVRFLITANDVIHSWWVPNFAVKKDAIPGFINESWVRVEEPGVYRGQCTELCGKDHGFMPVVVEVKSTEDYAAWVEEQRALKMAAANESSRSFAVDELIARGESVYNSACATCHMPNGQGMGSAFPAITGSSVALGPIAAHVDIIVNGKPGTAMQAFKDQLSAADIAAVVTYQRNRLGNSVGDSIQPSAIQ